MTNRVVTPVNLRERIALLQQKASNSSSSQAVAATSPTTAGVSPSTSSSPGNSGSALRERIAKFEEKGGVPVPRGSFGIGAPPPPLEQTHEGRAARKKGELYGNRIAIVARHRTGQASPPSALRPHLTGNVDIITASSRSLIPSTSSDSGLDVPGDGSPMRKRSVSTSSLTTKRPVSTSVFPTMSGTFDDDGDVNDSLALPGSQLFASNDSQSRLQFARRSSISGADAMRPFGSDDFSDGATSSSTTHENNAQPAQLDRSQENNLPESVSKPASFNDHHDHVIGEDQGDVPGQRADSVALSPEEAPPADWTKGRIEPDDMQDESSIKTPVVATFSPSSISVPLAKEGVLDPDALDVPNEDPELSDASTPFTDASSPLSASLEVGERVHSEPRKYVVMPPSRSSTLDQSENTSSLEAPRVYTNPENSASVLGISGTEESRASTETVSPAAPASSSVPPDVAEKSSLESRFTGSNSLRRRNTPAPLVIQHEKEYSEPSLDPKIVPKSFHAVVHGKTTLPTRLVPGNSDAMGAVPRPRVNVVRSQDGTPGTPGSPDLSTLLEQAMYLEQKLVGGEVDISTPRPEETAFQKSGSKSDMDRNSKLPVAFPRSGDRREVRDDVVPSPPLKSPYPRTLSQVATNGGPGSRKSWSRSSGNASSEDSVPVLTPPSPTFDLAASVIREEPQQISIEGSAAGVGELGEAEGRRSISSVFSSPGRSARKKVLSLFSRSGHSNSTLALPDDLLPSDPSVNSYRKSGSASSSVSVCPSSTLLPSPAIKETFSPQSPQLPPSPLLSTSPSYGPPSPISPHLRVKQDTPDVPRPVSVVSTTSVYSNAPSPLATELFDSFPDVPSSVPNSFEQDRLDEPEGMELRLAGIEGAVKEEVRVSEKLQEKVEKVEAEPQSPRPPTPPPKDVRSRDANEGPTPIPPDIEVNPLPPPKFDPPYSYHQYHPQSQSYQQPGPQPQSPVPPNTPSKDMVPPSFIRTSSSASSLSITASSHPLPRRSKSKSSLRLPHLHCLSSSPPPPPPLPPAYAHGNKNGLGYAYQHEREKSDSSGCTSDMHSQSHPPFPPSSFPSNNSSSTFSSSTLSTSTSSTSSTGIFSAISRTISSRRKRKNSATSALSINTRHGSSR